MARNTKGSHSFVLRNTGTGPLTLNIESTTCKCTLADVDEGILAPGETTQALLEWEAKGMDENFRHGATLSTNDPTKLAYLLSIEGRITYVVRAVPDHLRVGDISVTDTRGIPHQSVLLLA